MLSERRFAQVATVAALHSTIICLFLTSGAIFYAKGVVAKFPERVVAIFNVYKSDSKAQVGGLASLLALQAVLWLHRSQQKTVKSSGYIGRGLLNTVLMLVSLPLGIFGVTAPISSAFHWILISIFLIQGLTNLSPLGDNDTGAPKNNDTITKFWVAFSGLSSFSMLFFPAQSGAMYFTTKMDVVIAFHTARLVYMNSQLLQCARSDSAKRDAFAVYAVVLAATQAVTFSDWTPVGFAMTVAAGLTATHFAGFITLPGAN